MTLMTEVLKEKVSCSVNRKPKQFGIFLEVFK